jgi:hypothetical protein
MDQHAAFLFCCSPFSKNGAIHSKQASFKETPLKHPSSNITDNVTRIEIYTEQLLIL